MTIINDIKSGSLDGVAVLDFSWVVAGPSATKMLADMGATVIKVEQYKRGANERYLSRRITKDGVSQSSFSINMNRGKKSICVNLKSPKGIEIIHDLIKRTDVVMENFAPGVMERLNLDYESMKMIKDDIIYCSISCFGHWGPYSTKPGYDPIAQAACGWTDQCKTPLLAPVAIGDHVASLFATIGVLSALRAKEFKGIGQNIDISMMDCLISLSENSIPNRSITLAAGEPDYTLNKMSRYGAGYAPYGIYECKDGRITIALLSEARWPWLVECMGEKFAWLLTDPRTCDLQSRSANVSLVHETVNEWTSSHTVKEVECLLEKAEIPCMKAISIKELMDSDPQVKARDMLPVVEQPFIGPMQMIGNPIKMSETPACIRGYGPFLGEHNQEVLVDILGYSEEQVKTLIANDVIYNEPAVERLKM